VIQQQAHELVTLADGILQCGDRVLVRMQANQRNDDLQRFQGWASSYLACSFSHFMALARTDSSNSWA
jgi:hypothetical protein